MAVDIFSDPRIVLTLDAGGTNFAFSAMQAGETIGESFSLPSEAHDLERSTNNLLKGFQQLVDQSPQQPVAISFAFPGPADYRQGVIYNVGNLPAYQGGVPLGPLLEEQFGMPVYINNDGDLFAYGEAKAGFLPHVNRLLAEAGSGRRYRNLLAVTLGTGLGGGVVINGQLLAGDNSAAGEIWLLRNKVRPEAFAEEGASIRAVRRAYAEALGIDAASTPTPKEIFEIGLDASDANQLAARKAFEMLGEVVGDALANAVTLIDGLVVIGGGLAGAAPLFMPRLVREMNSTIASYDGKPFPRLAQKVFDLSDEQQLPCLLSDESRELAVPKSDRTITSSPTMRIGVGISALGTNRATSLGAYCYALDQLS